MPKVIQLLPARCQPVTRERLCVPTLQLQAVEGPVFPTLAFVLPQTLSVHLLWVPCAGQGQSGRCCCALEPCVCCATGPGLEREEELGGQTAGGLSPQREKCDGEWV